MPILTNPLESKYGFKSPGFTVDTLGNITARTISAAGVTGPDYTVNESSSNFIFEDLEGTNPPISLIRGNSYTIALNLNLLAFYIKDAEDNLYSDGLVHSSGDEGEDAQGKKTGTLTFTVPDNAPSLLYYTDSVLAEGIITISDPSSFGRGIFTRLTATGNVDFDGTNAQISIQPSGTGSVTVKPNTTGQINNMVIGDEDPVNGTFADLSATANLDVTQDVTVGGDVDVTGTITADTFESNGTGVPTINSSSSLILDALTDVTAKISGTTKLTVNNSGVVISSLEVTNGINNTTIGMTTPAEATFTDITIVNDPNLNDHATKKSYVDRRITAFSIAFGA